MTGLPSRGRRRIEQETAAKRLPVGCMAWGAVLGVIAGIMVAVYALPPILRSFYGEEQIAYREIYESEGKRIEVVSAVRFEAFFVVTVGIRSNQTWVMTDDDWELEVTTQEDRLIALAPDPAIPETAFGIVPGEERLLVLRFMAPGRTDAEPVELHLRSPRVGLALKSE